MRAELSSGVADDDLALYVLTDDDDGARGTRRKPARGLGSLAPPVWAAVKKAIDGGQPFMATRPPPPAFVGRSSTRFFVRQLPVPPDRAAAAFDDWREGGEGVTAPAGRLILGPCLPAHERAAGRAGEPLRALPGRLRPTRWIAAVLVELTVVVWSDDVTQLDLRPRGRAQRSIRMPASLYFAAGNGVLDVLVAELRARAATAA